MTNFFKGRHHNKDCAQDQRDFEETAKEVTGSNSAEYLGVDAETKRTVVRTENETVYMDYDDDCQHMIEDVVPHSREDG